MGTLFTDAQALLDSALRATDEGAWEDVAIIRSEDGQVRIVNPNGWNLENASAQFGASHLYCITRRTNRIVVTARSARERCVLEALTAVPVRNPMVEIGCRVPTDVRPLARIAQSGCSTAIQVAARPAMVDSDDAAQAVQRHHSPIKGH